MKQKIGIILTALIGVSAIVLISCVNVQDKVGYMDNAKVYDEFKLTKSLDEQLQGILQIKKNKLDSLELEVTMLQKKLQLSAKNSVEDLKAFELGKQEYFSRKKMLMEENERLTDQFNQQITKEINRLVKEYGKKNGYRLILGGNGTGNVMYAEDAIDVTKEIITYLNENYK